ncbi:GTPase ObgE [Candidatus Wolfebacteria bacterium]|nr:MAG: GTPase ObgE [Candidatus Wolfebacteria bacterium]
MAFVDELNIHIASGRGGDGVVRFLHLKGKEFSGPSGGDGGNGGDVYIKGIRDIGKLAQYRHAKEFKADDGDAGGNNSKSGKGGEDIILELPVGSVITNKKTGDIYELLNEEEEILILKGGYGGRGNERFKSSRNVTPQQSTPGRPGVKADFYIELKLIVDAGFIGFPNAGKSSLVNELTNAGAKVGSYKFTTLEPNLGALYELILADIPGLIEGASDGKGLGHKFLRHISRTRLLVHCISLESEDPVQDYESIRKELKDFDQELADKQEVIVLTKTDVSDESTIASIKKALKAKNPNIFLTSVYDDVSLKAFREALTVILREGN